MNDKKINTGPTKLQKTMIYLYFAGIVIFVLVHITFRVMRFSQLNGKLDALRAAGYPITRDELNDYYPFVPDSENAAKIYQKAFSMFHYTDDEIFEKDINGNKYPEPTKLFCYFVKKDRPKSFDDLVVFCGCAPVPLLGIRLNKPYVAPNRQFFNANRKCIPVLKQASELPRCRFPLDFSTAGTLKLSHFSPLRSSIRLLELATFIAAEDDNAQQAVENILTMLGICHALDNEPNMYSYYFQLWMLKKSIKTIEYTLSLIEIDDASLQEISTALENNLDEKGLLLERAVAGEQVKAIDFDFDPEFKSTIQFIRLFGIDTSIKLKILELNELVFQLDKSSYKAVKQYKIDAIKQFEELSSPYTLTQIFASYPTIELREKFMTEAKTKATIIGIAVERYRLKYHRLPEQLAQLVPEFIKKLPDDPFTDRPFRYVVGDIEQRTYSVNTENYPPNYKLSKTFNRKGDPVTLVKCPGWMVYSCSLDMDDDNGIPRWIQKEGSGDIPFRCVRKKK